MKRTVRDPARRLRNTVERLPRRTREAMLRGIDTNRIVVGAYVDPAGSGAICPMLAAHRHGGRTDVASFARAWDDYTGAKRPRRATRREVATLRGLLEQSLDLDTAIDRTPISQLAAQIRAERDALRRRRAATAPEPPAVPAAPAREAALLDVPDPDPARIRVRRRRPVSDLLTATERQLTAAGPASATPADSDREP